MNKFERQGAILRLVQERPLSTQAEVADALRRLGIPTVQATVSRDIAQLGLVKVRNEEGQLVYSLPGAADLDRLEALGAALRRWAVSVVATGNLVVLKTPPGYASALARALDEAQLPDVCGTVAGDDTVFAAVREGLAGAEIAEQLRHHLEGESRGGTRGSAASPLLLRAPPRDTLGLPAGKAGLRPRSDVTTRMEGTL
jgi:transcriptional regulator of arginine metabolism